MRYAAVAIAASSVAAGIAAVIVTASRDDAPPAALPPCARAAATIPRPLQLPNRLPFPQGTVFTSVSRNFASHGVPLIRGLMPLGLADATRFLDDDLPRAGVRVTLRRDARRRREAHYNIIGFGGFVKIEALPACEGATSFAVTARPTLLGRGHAE